MKYLFIVLLLMSTSILARSIDKLARPIDKIIFFGDSLSDTGRLYAFSDKEVPISPPYYNGRFTNGPVWSELFASAYDRKKSCNYKVYAIAGATAAFHPEDNTGSPDTLCKEVDDYLTDDYYKYLSKDSTLYVFWIGANDYLLPNADPNIDVTVQRVIDGISEQIGRLITPYGGQNFMILNLPDLSLTPYGRSSGDAARLRALTSVHNEKLAQLIGRLKSRYPDLNFAIVDIHTLFNQIISNPTFYGSKFQMQVVDVQHACWTGGYVATRSFTTNTDGTSQFSSSAAAVCPHPETYLFWDTLHPSAVVHKVLAQIAMQAMVQFEPCPECQRL